MAGLPQSITSYAELQRRRKRRAVEALHPEKKLKQSESAPLVPADMPLICTMIKRLCATEDEARALIAALHAHDWTQEYSSSTRLS